MLATFWLAADDRSMRTPFIVCAAVVAASVRPSKAPLLLVRLGPGYLERDGVCFQLLPSLAPLALARRLAARSPDALPLLPCESCGAQTAAVIEYPMLPGLGPYFLLLRGSVRGPGAAGLVRPRRRPRGRAAAHGHAG